MRMKKILSLLCLFPLLLSAAADEEGFRPLFNGKDLSGWVAVNTAPSTWSVVDGMIHCTGQPTGEMRTDRMYQNFILEVEWRHLKPRGNAGIFIWADDITARGQPFHRGIEVQVLENAYGQGRGHTTHGDIFPIHGAKMKPVNGRGGGRAFPSEDRSKPSPEWNHYRITCQDGSITLAVNGKVVTSGNEASPSKGYICLESEGGVVDYRNLKIKELPDTPVAAEDIAIADRGYRSLYTGVDVSGWTSQKPGAWAAQNWNLVYTEEKTDDALTSKDTFGDIGFIFDLRRTNKSKQTAVLLRGHKLIAIDGDTPWLVKKGWNRFEGTVKGGLLNLSVNGQVLLTDKSVGDLTAKGPLVLAPAGPVSFANIYVRDL
ncbi:MAG: hypothetical protein ACI9TH_004875 [Kiritimatiellia bacterium]|jgi:hypothetical protein